MEILEIELIEFLGMWLNNIRRFKLNIVSKVVLFLGRNGCGKTRLFLQMHPFSIQKKDYREGGGKRIRIRITNGDVYEIHSRMVGTSVKNTLKNITTDTVVHKDVNPSHHDEAMRDLVKWNTDIHRLVVDPKEQLTAMRIADRKYWFGKLSESDLNFAIKFHAKLKEYHRDIMGALKTAKSELSELALKVTEEKADYDQIALSLHSMRQQFADLNEQKNRLMGDPSFRREATREVVDARLFELAKVSKNILDLQDIDFDTVKHIDIDDVKRRIIELEYGINDKLKKAFELEQLISSALANSTESVEDLRKWIAADNELIGFTEASFHYRDVKDSVRTYRTDYEEILIAFKDIVGDMPANLTSEHLNQLLIVRNNINADLQKCTNFITYATTHLKHYEEADKTTCPKCSHDFISGYPEERVAELRNKFKEAQDRSMELKAALEKANRDYLLHQDWFNRVTTFNNVIERLASTNPVDYVILSQLNPNEIPSAIETLKADWASRDKLANLIDSREKLVVRLNACSERTPEWMHERETELEHLNVEIGSLRIQLDCQKAQLGIYNEFQDTQRMLQELKDEMGICYNSVEELTKSLFLNYEYEEIHEQLNHVGSMLEETNKRFLLMDENLMQFKRLSVKVSEYTETAKVTADLVRGMGPEEGLLSKHLYRAITQITDRMTEIIRDVWGYRIDVFPCNVENGELNYKFPYVIDGADGPPATDVSESSRGQTRLFDLTYTIAFYEAMELVGYPMFMDEPFANIDEGHQDKCIKYINRMFENGTYSQLLMISHDPAIHFQLTNVDYVVIDPESISLPSTYNKNVIIE